MANETASTASGTLISLRPIHRPIYLFRTHMPIAPTKRKLALTSPCTYTAPASSTLSWFLSGSLPPGGSALCGGGRPSIWLQRHRIPAGDGGAVVVHHGMLPRPLGNLNNRECCCRAQRAPQGRQTVGGGGLQRQPSGAGGRPEGVGYRGGYGNRGTGRYVGALPPAPELMMTV